MASVLRTGLVNLNPTGLLVGLCKRTSKSHNVAMMQVALISSRENRIDRPPRPPPFDWRNKKYNFWNLTFDPMEQRFDDNTKVVVVEGMPALGKDKFAKKLAEELDMVYFPAPSFDDLWINTYGFDYRTLNHKLPLDAQFFDIQSFLENPTGRNTAAMQVAMLYARCFQYLDVLTEVLSTGNGVVIQRCPWSDANFMQALLENNYVSRGAYDYYKSAALTILPELMKPHLYIYLDAPISVVKDNIKKRNIPYEVNSKALTDKYLNDLSRIYKDLYLREMSKYGHLLIYDWAKEGDVGVVVEDIERLDFDIPENSDKFYDWKYDHIVELKERRFEFHHNKQDILQGINVARFDVPEMFKSAEDCIVLDKVLEEVPSYGYAPGFNPNYDKGIWWKLNETWEDIWPSKNAKNKQ